MNMLELQEKFIGIVVKGAPATWDRIEIHYENYDQDGEKIVKTISKAIAGQGSDRLRLPLEGLRLLDELKTQIPAGQSEPWTWLEFSLDRQGKYKFDYKYGVPPLVAEALKYS